MPVDALEGARGRRARTEAAAVADERVREGHQWVEDDGPLAGRSARRRQVEVAGIADDERVEAARAARQQPRLGGGESQRTPRPCRPPFAQVVPDRDVLLHHLDACGAEARDHLRVPRIRALVRSEITDSQCCVCGGLRATRSNELV
jgi:hypothetical protein